MTNGRSVLELMTEMAYSRNNRDPVKARMLLERLKAKVCSYADVVVRLGMTAQGSEGKVFLRIRQEQTQKEIDITNTDGLLDMADFLPGRITFTKVNENGRNVDFELDWKEV